VETLEKLVPKATSTVQANRLTFKVGNSLFQNLWRKTHTAFLEFVEGG
jgi:CxxC motif-containing protein (DUF1111 family)